MGILHPQRMEKKVSLQGKGKLSIWEQMLCCEQLCRDPSVLTSVHGLLLEG